MHKVKDHANLVRDTRSQAILNTDKEEIARFQQMRTNEERLNKIEDDVSDIKEMLKVLLENNK